MFLPNVLTLLVLHSFFSPSENVFTLFIFIFSSENFLTLLHQFFSSLPSPFLFLNHFFLFCCSQQSKMHLDLNEYFFLFFSNKHSHLSSLENECSPILPIHLQLSFFFNFFLYLKIKSLNVYYIDS